MSDYDFSNYKQSAVYNKINQEEKIYGYPLCSGICALYYRKDIFDELNIDITNISWEEYIEIGRNLKDFGYNFLLPSASYFSNILMCSGGNYFYEDNKVNVENDLSVFELIKALMTEDLIPQTQISYNAYKSMLENGEILSIIGPVDNFSLVKEYTNQEWGITQIPKSDFLFNDVSYGGISFLIVNDFASEDIIEFLNETFEKNNQLPIDFLRNLSESCDIVPCQNFMNNYLKNLDNNGNFCNDVIEYLYDIDEDLPIFIYGENTNEIKNIFDNIISNIDQYNNQSATEIYNLFLMLVGDYLVSEKEIISIEIESPPYKTEYYKYEYFNSQGM